MRLQRFDELFYETDMALDFIKLTGFERDEDDGWSRSNENNLKGKSEYIESVPEEFAADVCALYILKQLKPNELRGYERYTKPPYLTEELEAWVERYVVLPQ